MSFRLLWVLVIGVGGSVGGLLFHGPARSGAWRLLLPPAARPGPHARRPISELVHAGHVDLATGLYIRQDEDLVLGGAAPFVLTRTYRSRDPVSRHFGIGATHNGEWYLRGDPERFQWLELILPEARRLRFDRTTPGTAIANAVFSHGNTPDAVGATAAWLGLFWAVRWPDGRLALFKSCGHREGDACAIVKARDADNHWTSFSRDATGLLRSVGTADGVVELEYDSGQRVVRASTSAGDAVHYEYDRGGRLAGVRSSTGAVRTYRYNDRAEMVSIEEPGHVIVNTFEDGRCVRHVSRVSDSYGRLHVRDIAMTYRTSRDGGTTTEVRDAEGWRTVWAFDDDRFWIGATHISRSGQTATSTVDRAAGSRAVRRVAVTCGGRTAPVTVARVADDDSAEDMTWALLEQHCAGWQRDFER